MNFSKCLKAITVTLAVTLIMSACQPTPGRDVVVNKGDGELREKLEQTNATSGKYEAPDTYKNSFSKYDGRLSIKVDASVEIPDALDYPVVSFEHEPFSQEQVNTMVSVLMNGVTMYEKSSTRTKDELT